MDWKRYNGIFQNTVYAIFLSNHYEKCRTVKVTDTEPYYIRAIPATKAFIVRETPLYT